MSTLKRKIERYFFPLILFIPSIIATIIPSNSLAQTTIFSEDFSDNHRKWEEDADDIEVSYVKDGRYHIKIAGDEEGVWHWFDSNVAIPDEANWMLETTIYLEKIENKVGFYGIVWGAQDVDNMFQAFISPLKKSTGGAVISKGHVYILFDTEDSDTINLYKTKFTLLKVGTKTYCLINGKPIGKAETGKLFGDGFGFVISPKTGISVDYLTIRTIDINDPYVQKIRSKFVTTEEKLVYYNDKGFIWNGDENSDLSKVRRITKEDASIYRVYTVDDDDNVIGYAKEYDAKTNKIIEKFQAKKISPFGKASDILDGERIVYGADGNILFKGVYFNPNNLKKKDFMISPTVDLYKCDDKEKIIGYKEIKDGDLKREIEFDENGEITKAQNKSDIYYYEKNAFGQYDKVFEENFDPPILDWLEMDIATSTSKITKEGYYIKGKTGDAGRISKVSIDYNVNDFSVGCMLDIKGSGIASIMLGLDTKGLNYTDFSISNDGQFTIYNMFNGVRIPVVEWTQSNYLRRGVNALDIIKIGKTIIFSINGTKVKTDDYFPLANKAIGLDVSGGNEAYFSNMVLKEINSELPEEFSKFLSKANEEGYAGSGTGFFISNNGYLVTNNHVVENAKEIYADVTENGTTKTYRATLVNTDKKNDLAILKINKTVTPLPYSLNANLEDVGTNVFTLGYPYALTYLGKEIKFTDGSISSKTGFGNDISTYQISVPVQPGNSGGPLFDTKGNIVGVVNAKFTKGDNVSYAIKSPILKSLLDLNPNVPRPSTVLKTDEIPMTSLIKKLEKFVVLIKIK